MSRQLLPKPEHPSSSPMRRTSSSSSQLSAEQSPSRSLSPAVSRGRGRPKNLPRPIQGGPPRPILPSPVPPPRFPSHNESGSSFASSPQNKPQGKQSSGFFHGPTNLPPQSYKGPSPMMPERPGPFDGEDIQRLPHVEARIRRLETAVDKYVEGRGQQALDRSAIPGLEKDEDFKTNRRLR